MIIKAQKSMTKISDDATINQKNYMESLSYISNLYTFVSLLKPILKNAEVEFLPTFKGRYTCEQMYPEDAESEMRLFKIKSDKFLEDLVYEKVISTFNNISEFITKEGNVITIILKRN